MITDLLMHWASRTPDRTFVVTDSGSYSYSEIASLSRRFTGQLRSYGVGHNDHVAILADNSAAYIVAWFGISLLGGVAVTLNNQIVSDSLRYSVKQSDSKLIVADREWINNKSCDLSEESRALPVIPIESEGTFFESLRALPEAEAEIVPASHTCAIIYTSGTTGLPKGVMNSHSVYLATGRETAASVGLTAEDVTMAVLPLFHANTQMFAVMPSLTVGGGVALQQRFSAGSFFQDARRFGATGHTAVGTIISILLARHPKGCRDHQMRFCIPGGVSGAESAGKVLTEYERLFGIRMYEAFGMTEIGGFVAANSVSAYRAGSCGLSRRDIEIRIFDDNDREVPAGKQGEIVVRPKEPFVILTGYYGRPDLMTEACRNLWFHTGDRGSFDADGFLYFHGRIKELIRRKGEMISPVEIENKLRELAYIEDCAVVGIPNEIVGEEIKAIVVTQRPVEASEIRDFLSAHFPDFMLPRYIEFLAKIPKTATEKILRKELQYLSDEVHDLAQL